MVSIFIFRLALCRRCTGASRIRGLQRKNERKRLGIALKRTLFMFPRWRLDTRSGHAVQWQLFRCSRFRYQNVRTARGYTLVCAAGAQHAALQSYCVSTTSIVSINRECKRVHSRHVPLAVFARAQTGYRRARRDPAYRFRTFVDPRHAHPRIRVAISHEILARLAVGMEGRIRGAQQTVPKCS